MCKASIILQHTKNKLILLILSNIVVLLAFLSKPFRNQIAIEYLRKFALLPC